MKLIKRYAVIFFMGIISLCFISCGTKTQNTKDKTTDVEKKEEKEMTEISSYFAEGMNQFAYDMFEQLEEEKNIFLSPYSIASAISMLTNGATNDTKKELEIMLGIKDLDSWNGSMKIFINSFQDKKAEVKSGNSIWFTETIPFNETAQKDFFEPLESYYGATSEIVDFTDISTVEKINKWVSGKTEGMIDPFLEQLNPATKMCLINAVYFKGEWQSKFKHNNTLMENFYGAKKKKVVEMMHIENAEYKYIEKNNIRVLEMPYGEGQVVMDILLPKDKSSKSIQQIFQSLTNKEKDQLLQDLAKEEVQPISMLALPKFQMEYGTIEIKSALQKLGMNKSFTGEADFSIIADDLYVSNVLHKAKIEVDEEGSKAAAATSIEIKNTSAILEDSGIQFIVDEPFIYLIRDTKTGIILFIGDVKDL